MTIIKGLRIDPLPMGGRQIIKMATIVTTKN